MGVWPRFRQLSETDPRDTSMGYTAHIWGTSLGLDMACERPFLFGVSGGFAKSHIRTSDSGTRTDADSYQGNLYASYFRDRWRVDGSSPARTTATTGRDILPSAALTGQPQAITEDTSTPGISKEDTPSPAQDGTSRPCLPALFPLHLDGYRRMGRDR
jgi:hypothetical protein